MISLILLSVAVFGLLGAWVVTQLAHNAPVGYEDAGGFHFANAADARAFARAQEDKKHHLGHTQHPFTQRG